MNWRRPLPYASPGSRVGIADSGQGCEAAGRVWHGSFSVLQRALESLRAHTLPNRTTSCDRGELQSSVAKSEVLNRCQKQICLCEISQSKNSCVFFFTSCGGGPNKTFMDQIGSPACNLCTWPFLLFLHCVPSPHSLWPYQSKLDPIGRPFLLGNIW